MEINKENLNKKKKTSIKKPKFSSIKFSIIKIIISFCFIVVLVFEIFSYNSIMNYNEASLVGAMLNQARYNQVLYANNLTRYNLSEIIIGDKNSFYRNNVSQVQILDNSATVLFDSLASSKTGKKIRGTDIQKAKDGQYAYQKNYNDLTKQETLSLSYPITDNQKQIGILRLTSSMDKVNDIVNKQMRFYFLFGLLTLILTFFLSVYASERWIYPIKALTKIGEKLAQGDFKAKADESGNNEISELASTLNFMSENIIKREDMKNEFISSVSHELRTPLTSIKGWAITLQSKDIQKNEDMLNQGLTIIENEGERLSMMVEDLLDFSRLSSSSFEYHKENLNIVDLIKEVHAQLYPRATNAKINFSFLSSYDTLMINADKNRMKEVFINIIDNAIKFTPENGDIDIIITTDNDDIYITVKDTGEGIKEDEIAFVASKFYKGTSSKSQTGLGLSISEEIVKAHKGKLIIKSKYTEGTSVTVILPRISNDEKN
ncbi:MAG: HAMP domain-containing sensor histidine kinase [Peptoniphilaceae bacterium]|nr:HAMP domain-containing sensor histidine kinase [Peptoniphilaceae bacterium]MDY6018660.1 HAMP domain-containing sensor histidine kinase [Anaerococcus sp.]